MLWPAPRVSRRQGLAHGTRNQLAAALPGIARGENFKYFNANGRAADTHASGGQNRASAVNGDGHDGHVGTCRRGKCAAQKLADLASLVERALGKEHQGLAGGGELQYTTPVDPTLVSIEPFHQLRSP